MLVFLSVKVLTTQSLIFVRNLLSGTSFMFILIGHYCDWWQDRVWAGCITWEGLSSESSAVAKWVVLARQLLHTLQLPVGPHVFGIAAFICTHIHSNATIFVALFRRLDTSPEKWKRTHTSWSMNQKVSAVWNSLTCYKIKLHSSDIDRVPCVISFCMHNHLVMCSLSGCTYCVSMHQ